MRILHVPLALTGLWLPARYHFENLINLGPAMGLSNICIGSATVDMSQTIKNSGSEIVHFFGWPEFSGATEFLKNLKAALFAKKKVVISLFNYAPLCSNGILEGNEGECHLNHCAEKTCEQMKNTFDFLKNFNIFVYSKQAVDIYKSQGYTNVHQMPICYFEDHENYIMPKMDELANRRLALLYPSNLFYKDIEILNSIKNQNKSVIYFDVHSPYQNFDANYSLISYSWKNAFPFEIGWAMKSGSVPIVHSKYDFQDYDDISDFHLVDINTNPDQVGLLASRIQDISERKELAYRFWHLYGPSRCQAYYRIKYEEILNEN